MMRKTMMVACMAMLMASCAKPGPPPKPQPGSWSMKMELLDAQGAGADKIKAAMGPMLGAMSNMSVCVTPEDAAKSDPAANITKGNGDCKFDKQEITSAAVHVAGTCTKNGVASKVAADGTISATAQDLTITTEGPSPAGGGQLTMKMRMQTQRTGECKPTDMKAPPGMM